ncbi:hypothetical protein PLESTF_000770600 [Pleodorina starrii]|nr:hypothetical protein PLESTF_000770600 [Pleodorina starrii]
MLPSASPERPVKRSRLLPSSEEAAVAAAGELFRAGCGGCGGGGDDGAAAAAAADPSQAATGSRQPLLEKQQPQPTSQQCLQQPPQPQAPSQSPSEPQPPPQQQQSESQSQPQPPSEQQQPQSQSQHQLQLADVSRPSGAIAVLPTALPQWAEEALRGVDPFWQPKETLAVITTQQAGPAPGTHGQLQSASALFTVSPAALAAIADKRAQARLVCVQPWDGPPRRCHWYGGSYVLLNGRPYEVTKEDRVQLLLGPNQSDQAANLSSGLVRGANRLTLLWPLGVAGAVAALRLCEPRDAAELHRRLAAPLPLQRAVALVRAHVAGEGEEGGGAAAAAPAGAAAEEREGEGSALGSGPVTVSLRCPLHGGLAAAPAHFGCTAAAAPLAFFDLGAFLELSRSGGTVCPASGRLGELEDVRPHAFLTAVLRTLDHNGVRGRVEAIEVSPCGRWRPKDSRVPLLSVLDAADPTDPRVIGSPPSFDPRLLDPEDATRPDVVDLTDD